LLAESAADSRLFIGELGSLSKVLGPVLNFPLLLLARFVYAGFISRTACMKVCGEPNF
jgi:hypothetical protein